MVVKFYYGPKAELIGVKVIDVIPVKGTMIEIGDMRMLKEMKVPTHKSQMVTVTSVQWTILEEKIEVNVFID